MAALNAALTTALIGLSAEQAQELKRSFGWVMGEVIEKIINPAVLAFPELTPDAATWATIVAEQAQQLCTQLAPAT